MAEDRDLTTDDDRWVTEEDLSTVAREYSELSKDLTTKAVRVLATRDFHRNPPRRRQIRQSSSEQRD